MKRKVIFETRQVTQSGTLVLNNPAEVTFINQNPTGGNIVINNTIFLGTSASVIQGLGDYLDRITFRTNLDEIDVTDYQVFIPANTTLIVICKYYI
jgi:hypothetical protein